MFMLSHSDNTTENTDLEKQILGFHDELAAQAEEFLKTKAEIEPLEAKSPTGLVLATRGLVKRVEKVYTNKLSPAFHQLTCDDQINNIKEFERKKSELMRRSLLRWDGARKALKANESIMRSRSGSPELASGISSILPPRSSSRSQSAIPKKRREERIIKAHKKAIDPTNTTPPVFFKRLASASAEIDENLIKPKKSHQHTSLGFGK